MDRVIVCRTCAGGTELAAALDERVPEGTVVETVECLNICDTPVSLALRGAGKDVYLFSGVSAADVGDAVALVRLYRDAPGGTIADARPAGRLRQCLVGRVPA